MDGGRRLLRSLTEAAYRLADPPRAQEHAFAGAAGLVRADAIPMPAPVRFEAAPALRRSERRDWRLTALKIVSKPGVGACLAGALLLASGVFGAVRGGEYAQFVATQGDLRNVMARTMGFGVAAVTITGGRELPIKQILAAAGVSPRSSLLFLDADKVRERLLKLPLVKDASVDKLFPNRLVINIIERKPFALWQKDGKVSVIAADGTPIDSLNDPRLIHLPFVVGEGANAHIAQFVRLLNAAGDLRDKIRAGVYIGERRWNLNLTNGMEVDLPETGASAAVAEFARVARQSDLLNKDLISIDLRMPGRLVLRISEEAAAARLKKLGHRHVAGEPM